MATRFDSSLKGKTLVASVTANIRSAAGVQSPVQKTVKEGANAGIATGEWTAVSGTKWYQLQYPGSTAKDIRTGWISEKVVSPGKTVIPPPSGPAPGGGSTTTTTTTTGSDFRSEAEKVAKDLVSNDLKLYQAGLKVLSNIQKLKASGKPEQVRKAQAAERVLAPVVNRFFDRQRRLRENKALQVSTRISEGITAIWNWVKEKTGMSGIGEPVTISTGVIIGVAVAVGAIITLVILNALKSDYHTSVQDLFKTEEWLKLTSGEPLTAEEQKTLQDNIQTTADESYNQGRDDQKTDDFTGILKNLLLLGVGGYIAIKVVEQSGKSKR